MVVFLIEVKRYSISEATGLIKEEMKIAGIYYWLDFKNVLISQLSCVYYEVNE